MEKQQNTAPATMQTRANQIATKVLGSVVSQLETQNVKLSEYQRECGLNAITAIDTMLTQKGIAWNDPALDPSNYQAIVRNVALLKLNPAASNREVYFSMRNVKYGNDWKKVIEVGIEGDGNDAILRNFGVDVDKVYTPWIVRENDTFVYPKHKGLEVTAPEWEETGEGKVVRVVYPIQMKDGKVEYRIAEREDVVKNLHAHINNNMMNETFGICADRYKATAEQKQQITLKKIGIMNKLKGLSLDEILDCADVQDFISDAWKAEHSREAMILRKMRNNAIKKFPKDFGSAYALDTYNEISSDEATKEVITTMHVEANTGEVIDVDPTPVQEQTANTPKPAKGADESGN